MPFYFHSEIYLGKGEKISLLYDSHFLSKAPFEGLRPALLAIVCPHAAETLGAEGPTFAFGYTCANPVRSSLYV